MRKRLGPDGERGAAVLEFSLVLPLFVFIIYALIAFGMALSTKHQVTNAAAEGARATVGAADYATAMSRSTARITSFLGAPNGRYTVSYPGSATTCGTSQCIEVTVVWDYQHHPVVASAPGLGVFMPNSLTSKAVVAFS